MQSLVASWLRMLWRPAPLGRAPSELWQCRRRAYANAYAWPVRREPWGEVGRPKLAPVASLLQTAWHLAPPGQARRAFLLAPSEPRRP